MSNIITTGGRVLRPEDWKFEVTNIKYMDCYTEVDMSIYEIFLINFSISVSKSISYSSFIFCFVKYNLFTLVLSNKIVQYDGLYI